MDIFQQFGIDWRLLSVQIFNFVILLFILHKLLFKPLLVAIEKRRKTIEESAKAVARIEAQTQEAQEKITKELAEAKMKAQEIVALAQTQAKQTLAQAQDDAQKRTAEMLTHAEQVIAQEKEQLMQSVQKDIVHLVVAVAKKVLHRELRDTNEQYIMQELENMQKKHHEI